MYLVASSLISYLIKYETTQSLNLYALQFLPHLGH